ncbi:MAG: hypothetical protein JWO45_1945, partial [Spartobacteria bacterium]|nr:hypothetical protein [Spartobacteria bacterium]
KKIGPDRNETQNCDEETASRPSCFHYVLHRFGRDVLIANMPRPGRVELSQQNAVRIEERLLVMSTDVISADCWIYRMRCRSLFYLFCVGRHPTGRLQTYFSVNSTIPVQSPAFPFASIAAIFFK